MRFVVIGGDAAGMSAASRAKRNMPELEVTVFEQSGDVSYSACGMPYNIADPRRKIDELVVREARVFRDKQGIDLRTGHRVDVIDPDRGQVRGRSSEGGEFVEPFDRLLVATGASPIVPDLPGMDLEGVMCLKSLQDGRRIKAFLETHTVKRAVIIGMGYIALEMCEAFVERGIQVEMVKPRPIFLPWLHPDLAAMVRGEVEERGAVLHTGCGISGIEEAGAGLRVICDGPALEADIVLVAVGVKPNSDLAAEAGLELGPSRAVAVDRTLRTSHDTIYSAGDCADAFHVVTGDRVWIPLALRANRAGWAVADNVTGKPTEVRGVVGTAVFKVFDMQVARTGLTPEEASRAGFEPAEVIIKGRSRAHAHPGNTTLGVRLVGDRKSGRLLGAQMAGREGAAHRINAPAVALHAGMLVEEFAQCDLAYAPPFSPVWDPMLTAANQLLKAM